MDYTKEDLKAAFRECVEQQMKDGKPSPELSAMADAVRSDTLFLKSMKVVAVSMLMDVISDMMGGESPEKAIGCMSETLLRTLVTGIAAGLILAGKKHAGCLGCAHGPIPIGDAPLCPSLDTGVCPSALIQ
jgi:hypothetical protein